MHAVLWIRDILIWIRVRGSLPLTYGSESGSGDPAPDPALFVSDLQDANLKIFFSNFFGLLRFEGTFTSVFKDKKS